MFKAINLFVVVMVVFFSTAAQAQTLSQDAREVHISGLLPGEPGHAAEEKYLLEVVYLVLKYQGVKEVDCLSHTDAITCAGRKGSWQDRTCQAKLAKSRCRAVGNVLFPLGIKVRPIEGGEERQIKSGKNRGVTLYWENAFCTQNELDSTEEIRLELDRKVLDSNLVTVVPAKNLPCRPSLVVLSLKTIYDREGKEVGGGSKTCLAMVNPSVPVAKKLVKVSKKVIPPAPAKEVKVLPPVEETPATPAEPSWFKGRLSIFAGIGNHSFCPELSGRTGQLSIEGGLKFAKHFRLLAGLQTIQMVTGLDEETGMSKSSRIPMPLVGLEAAMSLADLGVEGALSQLSFGVVGKVMGDLDSRYPIIGMVGRYQVSPAFYLEARLERVSFIVADPNGLPDEEKTGSSWNAVMGVGFQF